MTLICKGFKMWKVLPFLFFCIIVQLTAFSAWATPFVYIPNRGSNNVTIIDTATNAVMGSIPVGSEPVGIAVSPSGARVYVTNHVSNTVTVIDANLNTVIATIPVGMTPWGIIVDTSGSRVYVTNPNSDTVSVIDTTTNTVTSTIQVGSSPMGIAVNPSGTRVYVANYGRSSTDPSTVMAIDTATNIVVATIQFEENYYAYNIAINDTGSLVYVEGAGRIWVIDAPTNSIINTIQFSPGDQGGIALNPSRSKIYVTNHNDRYVSVIDTITSIVTDTISVGSNPEGIAVNPEGTSIYVANNSSNDISVIDAATNIVISTIRVGLQPGAFSISIGGPDAFVQPPPSPPITRITNDGLGNSGPHFNHDGSKLTFFSSKGGGNGDIYIINADGSGETRLTSDPAREYQPHFSPDGTKIVFKSVHDGHSNIWVMNANGSNPAQLTFDTYGEDSAGPPSYGADWSPDGSKIVFDSMRADNYDIWLMNADGSNPVQLTTESNNQAHPHFSPDGSRIVYWSEQSGTREIWVMDANGANKRQVTSFGTGLCYHPHFNHNGTQIGFVHDGRTYFVNVDGTGLQQFPYDVNASAAVDWSPDGTKIAYMALGDIWIYNLSDATPPTTTATPPGGTYTSAQTVILTTNEPATIYYTLDGTTPLPPASLLVYTGPITISSNTTLKIASKDLAGNIEAVQTQTYIIDTAPPVIHAVPSGNIYPTAQSVKFTLNEGAAIYYTTDGTVPTTTSPVYSGSISIAANTTLKFFAVDAAGNNSPVLTESYIIDPGAASYVSTIVSTFESFQERYETVDAIVTEGRTLNFAASGAIFGELTENVSRWVTIQTGTYAGWSYRKGTYQFGPYSGEIYMVHNGIKAWGMMTGDVHGVRMKEGEIRKLYLTSIRGVPASGTVDITMMGQTAGTTTSYPGMQLLIATNATSGTLDGHHSGSVSTTTNRLKVMGFSDGLVLSNYQTSEGSGEAFLYADDPAPNLHPGVAYRYGMVSGPLFGTREIEVPVPVSVDSQAYARAEHVAGPYVLPPSPEYITNSIQVLNEQLPAQSETVNVSLEQGAVLTFAATGSLSGDLVENVSRWVTIQTGTYAGWSYRKGTYQIGPYSGEIYTIQNEDKAWGMLTGDIHGVRARDGEDRKIYITSIRGAQSSGVVNLAPPHQLPGTQTFYPGVPLYITQSTSSGQASGFFDGEASVAATTVKLGPFSDAIQINPYQSTMGSGTTYLYADLDQQSHPGVRYQKGMSDGPLFGSREVESPHPATVGSKLFVRIEHVLDAVAPAVTANPGGGTYPSAQTVILSANEASTIYYALDGFADYAVYTGPLTISGSNHLKYYAVDAAGNSGAVQMMTYTIGSSPLTVNVSPAGGYYTSAQTVTLTASEPATIYYAVDGFGFVVYTGPITISGTNNLKYYAVDGAGNASPVQYATYDIFVASNISAINATFTEFGPSRNETADISVQQGRVQNFDASGFLAGQLVENVSRWVTVKTGAYAGWSYRVGTYQLGPYTGGMYMIHNGNQAWGMMEGDINGIRIRNGNVRTLYVTSLQGTSASGRVDLAYTGGTPPASTYDYPGVPITIGQNSQVGSSTGLYGGPTESKVTYVFNQMLREGFVLGSYQSDLGSGSIYMYADNSNQSLYKRKGISTGGIFATRDAAVPLPANVGTSNYTVLKHYTGSRLRGTDTLIADYGNRRVFEVNAQGETVLSFDAIGLQNPVDAQRVSGDRTLISDSGGNRVIEVDNTGTVLWQYADLHSPRFVERLFNGNTLIADNLNHRVVEVHPGGGVVWEYGIRGMAGTAAGQLNQPTAAYRLADSTTVIVDTGNHRVIKVKTGDFPVWKDSSITWQYGETGVAGSGPGQLNMPRRTQLLDSGNVLISDSMNHRVIEVSPDKRIIWQYGQTAMAGMGPDQLNGPKSVQRLVNGDTIIADDLNHRIIEVTPRKSIIWQYGTTGQPEMALGFLNSPKAAYDVLPVAYVPDTTPPTGQIVINGGAASTNTPFVTITAQVGDNSGTVAAMRFSNDNFTWYGWQPFVTNKSWSLTPEVGTKTVYAQFKDASGNIMTTSATITLTAVPQLSSSIPAGTNVTTAPTPSSSVTFSDVESPGTVTMTPVNSATTPANFKVLTGASYEVTTDAAYNGTINICIGYNDASLANPYNEGRIRLFHYEGGQWVDITTSVDTFNKQVCGMTTSLSPFTLGEPTTPPVSVITSPMNGAVRPAGVTLITGTATDNSGTGIQKLEVSTNNGVTWNVATDTSGNGSWSSWSYSWAAALNGIYTLQSRATDNNGLEEVPAPGVTVTVDAAPPTVTVSPAGGTYVSAQIVTLSASEPTTIYFTLDGSTPTTSSAVYGSPITISSSKTLKYFARDTAGNSCAVQAAAYTITPDNLPPTGSVVINAGVATTTGTSVMLTLSAADNSGAVAQMRFSNDGSSWGSWIPYASTATWDLTTGDGLRTVYAQFNDAVGNVSSLPYPSDTIQLSTAAAPPVAASKVPVMNGWWLVPAVLGGLGLLYRRRDS